MESNYEEFLGNSLKYLSEDERLATYTSWRFTLKDPCNAKKMAEAGFIFIGTEDEPDAVKCFFCEKQLDHWEATDDPWIEHLEHAPECLFAKLQKPQVEITSEAFFEIQFNYTNKIKRSYCEKLFTLHTELCKTLEEELGKD